jgi:hypothetical protein
MGGISGLSDNGAHIQDCMLSTEITVGFFTAMETSNVILDGSLETNTILLRRLPDGRSQKAAL